MTIPVIDNDPDGRKKGLRMKIISVETDDDGKVTQLVIKYSTGKSTGMWCPVIDQSFTMVIEE